MSLVKRFGRRLAALGAIAATACSAAPAAEPKPAKPAMWKVADKDTTIYLFGTIHMLPKDTNWRSPAFEKAADHADTLVVETVIDETNPAAAIAELYKLAMRDGLPPIAARVKPEKRKALEEMIAKSGMPAPFFDKMETWAAAFTLLGVQFKELGLDPNSGVETSLKKQFADDKKPIGQLETNAEQFGYLDGLSEEAQRQFLDGVLEDSAAMRVEFDRMLVAWRRGNVKGVAKTFNGEFKGTPELMDALLLRRNANWANWVRGRLDQPGTVLVAVGAGHLAGDRSVLNVLKKQGLKVTRVQ